MKYFDFVRMVQMLMILGRISSAATSSSSSSRVAAFAYSRGRHVAKTRSTMMPWQLCRPSPFVADTCMGKTRFSSSQSNSESNQIQENTDADAKGIMGKKKKKKKPKIKIDVSDEKMEKLAAAFEELARKDGFDSSMARLADDDTFEDYFDDDDDFDFDDDDNDDDDDNIAELEATSTETPSLENLDDILDKNNFDLSDFLAREDGKETIDTLTKKVPTKNTGTELDLDDDDDDDYDDDDDDDDDDSDSIDIGGGSSDDDIMEARIAQARADAATGRVTIPKHLEDFASSMSDIDLEKLGYRRELDPFGNDETPRREEYKLIADARTCSACGSDFQSHNRNKPGYLPPEKFEIQMKLAKIEELQKLNEKAASCEWTPEDEVQYLLQTSDDGPRDFDPDGSEAIDIEAAAEEMGLDLAELTKKKVICKRCHDLQNYGKVDEVLRPGWTEEPTMSQETFRTLLRPIGEKPAVIVAIIDLFDFSGSVLRELDGIAGENPVILAANKVDLLPSKMGKLRAENWVRRELEYMGVQSLANIGGAVRLISSKNGSGVSEMLAKARDLAEKMECDVYIVGAANAGKSTLINNILGTEQTKVPGQKVRPGNKNAFKGALTTSPLPGTTLKFIKVDLGDGCSLYDTPGLLVPGTFTQLLTPEELKVVCPKKPIEPITFRVASGKCVLVGGLARIEVIGDSKPFMFTFFVANEIKLHPTDSSKAEEMIQTHAGGMLTPPLGSGAERMAELGPFESHVVDIAGMGWKEAAADITISGLGWVSVTGAGNAKVKITVPKGIGIAVRPPLMPFDVWEVAAKYTGGRAVRRTAKSKTGKRRKGVGRN